MAHIAANSRPIKKEMSIAEDLSLIHICSRHIGVDEDQPRGDQGVVSGHGDGRGPIEPKPAEPQDEHTEGTEREAVAQDGPGFAVLVVFAQSGAEDGGADTGTCLLYTSRGV